MQKGKGKGKGKRKFKNESKEFQETKKHKKKHKQEKEKTLGTEAFYTIDILHELLTLLLPPERKKPIQEYLDSIIEEFVKEQAGSTSNTTIQPEFKKFPDHIENIFRNNPKYKLKELDQENKKNALRFLNELKNNSQSVTRSLRRRWDGIKEKEKTKEVTFNPGTTSDTGLFLGPFTGDLIVPQDGFDTSSDGNTNYDFDTTIFPIPGSQSPTDSKKEEETTLKSQAMLAPSALDTHGFFATDATQTKHENEGKLNKGYDSDTSSGDIISGALCKSNVFSTGIPITQYDTTPPWRNPDDSGQEWIDELLSKEFELD